MTTLAGTEDSGASLDAMREAGLRGIVYREVFGPAPRQAQPALQDLLQKVEAPVSLINDFGDLRNALITPDFTAWKSGKFWEIVVTLAIVASLETLLSVEAVDKLDPRKRDSNSNKELVAQGIGNMTCGLVGALPVTAVIVRSSANVHAGATKKLSAILHAVFLLISILLIPHLLMLIPNAALAGILIFTGYKLTKVELFTEHYRKGIDQFLPFIVTILVMLLTDLLKGVGTAAGGTAVGTLMGTAAGSP